MIDKKKLKLLFSEESEYEVSEILDKVELVHQIEYPVMCDSFYPPSIWKKMVGLEKKLNVKILTISLTENSEKAVLFITPIDYEVKDEMEEEIQYFKINSNNKFKTLLHKDFLGTIMSLGLKRETLGDLIVEDGQCYGITKKETFKILQRELKVVSNLPVEIESVEKKQIPIPKMKEFQILVPSNRLDSVLSEIINKSRNESTELLERGDVQLNYTIEKSKNKEVTSGDVISVYKKGKFVIGEEEGENKKGKIKIKVKQFI